MSLASSISVLLISIMKSVNGTQFFNTISILLFPPLTATSAAD